MAKELIIIYALLDILLILISLIVGKNWLINTQISFFCAILIAYATYKTYKNKIQSELSSGKFDDVDWDYEDGEEDEWSDRAKKGKHFSVLLFFSPLKLASYTILAASFYLLVKFSLIAPIAFFIGVIPMPLGAFIYGAFFTRG